MACVRVQVLFGLLWIISFAANKIDATRKVEYNSLNDGKKKEEIRIRREVKDRRPCGNFNKSMIDPVNGFSPFTTQDCDVQFLKDDGKYMMKINWKTPIGPNNNTPVAYSFWWFVFRYANVEANHHTCELLSKTKTSLVLHTSDDWEKDETIYFAILPFPANLTGDIIEYNFIYTPKYTDVRRNDPIKKELNSTQSTPVSTTNSTNTATRSTTTFTETTNRERSLRTQKKVLEIFFPASKKKRSKHKEIFTIVTVTIAATGAISLFGFLLVLRFRDRVKSCLFKPTPSKVSRDPDLIYASYISENKGHTEKVVDFGSWLRKHGYNVQMDIMLSPSNQQDLKELGRLRWGAEQLSKARSVFLLVSPSYLKLCRLDVGETNASSLTLEEKIIFSEITQMRNDLSNDAYISSRFIPVLFGVKETELPFWIRQRVVYSWPDDKMNDRLLHRVRAEVSYENEDIIQNNIYSTKA
ncbi:uncharacterized protein LOC114529472 [Dendronephthya gigantea]|uniref:uncharacterized protein LOC114529472 n=1 Tax=Dendronephthya gigantea TaxID=151771 RepID=UPI001069D3ED|nr:uncharacterized protein LOC114529472 [Dendronephthya gigantea]